MIEVIRSTKWHSNILKKLNVKQILQNISLCQKFTEILIMGFESSEPQLATARIETVEPE